MSGLIEALFTEADIISRYTRAQAIEDGVLIDAGKMAREAGLTAPVALTSKLWHEVIVPDPRAEEFGQSVEGRLWDALWMLSQAARRSWRGPTIVYSCIFVMKARQRRTLQLKATLGPGDNGEPVITLDLAS